MKVWLIQRAESLPTDEGKQRLFRTGMLAQALADHGHDVLWWTSTFDHYKKKHRSASDALVKITPNYHIFMLHGIGYKSNVSLLRLLDQYMLAWKFRTACGEEEKPDVILSSLPSVEMSLAAVEYGKANSVPVILDMRDMWPDIFVDFAPSFLKPFARLVLSFMFRDACRACAGATAICGITESFVDWGVKKAGRERGIFDRSFPFAYSLNPPDPESLARADAFWDSQGILKNEGFFTVCFFGAIGHQFDFDTVFQAFKHIDGRNKVRLVVCGSGAKLGYYKNLAGNVKNVIFPGRVDAPAIYSLMRRSDAGLDPLPDRYDFLATINNKAVEYMSAGLPVLSSPKRGVLYQLLKDRNCGMSYGRGNEQELVALITELVSNRSRLKEMSLNALQLFHERFTAERVYTEMIEFLEKMAAVNANRDKTARQL